VVTIGPQRLTPPESLPEPARRAFLDIVCACKPEHFAPCDAPLLARYSEAVAMAEQAAARAISGDAAALNVWTTATRAMNALAMRLRLSPQARQPNRANRPQPVVSYYERMRLEARDAEG
jgi:hypothetical protein